MLRTRSTTVLAVALAALATGIACTVDDANTGAVPVVTPSPSVSPTPAEVARWGGSTLTLPLLDAMFYADEQFESELREKLQLSSEQIASLRRIAREETAQLRESEGDYQDGSTRLAIDRAAERIKGVIGEEKMAAFSALVVDHWQHHPDVPAASATDAAGGAIASASPSISPSSSPGASPYPTPPAASGSAAATPSASPSASPAASPTPTSSPYAPPTDTRIVVNAPAYRMDVFENGQLVKSYRIGIGYPEFPLPTGQRYAKSIIFNPTWTPPDEPWVESPRSKVKVGEKVPAGSKLNPLGLAKIPIGMPSLIHGGKSEAQLGGFASHGCVGLTDAQLEDFALLLARLGGASLTPADIDGFRKNRKVTREIKLETPIPVELRYQTIIAEDGKLYIYRDVYDQGTNSEEQLRAVLGAWDVDFGDLGAEGVKQAQAGLTEMSRDARGRAVEPKTQATPGATPAVTTPENSTGTVTRTVKGRKEVVIPVAALEGRGYPAPVAFEAGTEKKGGAKKRS